MNNKNVVYLDFFLVTDGELSKDMSSSLESDMNDDDDLGE